jgi:hypothetical protein
VEARHPELNFPVETRMDGGWRLAKLCWRLTRSNRSLLALGFGFALFALAAGLAVLATARASGGSFLLLAAMALVATVLAVFLQAGVVLAADDALDGGRTPVRDALADARERLRALAGWAGIAFAVQLAFALLLQGLGDRLGLFVSLAASAWSFGTVFVVPMLALELLTPTEALREAPQLLRRRWGEEFAGFFGIGAIAALAAIPPGILLAAGVNRNEIEQGSGDIAVAIAAVLLFAVFALAAATSQAFAAALYRDGSLGYPDERAYVERRPRRKSWIVRIGLAILALMLTLAMVGAIIGPAPDQRQFKVAFPPGYAAWISPGMAVVYDGRKVGSVKGSELTAATDIVSFEVEEPYESLRGASSIVLGEFEGSPCLQIVPRGQDPPLPEADRGAA